jgi:hypothetical protein
MKKVTFISGLIICMLVTACSKKSDQAPAKTTHTIKITASATAAFATVIYTADSFGGVQTEVKNVTVAAGTSFEFSEDLQSGSYVFLKLSSDISNKITFKIYDNGTLAMQESGKIFTTHSTSTTTYQVE